MGRPRKNQTLTDELLPDPPTDAEMSAELEYQDFISGLGDGNVSVTIHRFPKFGNVLEWCENAPLERSTLEAIRENHGPGKYKLTFRGPTGFMGAKTVCIAPEYDKNGTGKSSTTGNLNGNGNDFLHEHMIMQQNMMTALVGSMKGPDIGALLAGMAAMVTAMKPSEGAKPVDPLAMFSSILGMYQTLKPKEEKSELDRLRDTAAVIKEFAGDGKGGIESGWEALAKVGEKAIDQLSPLLSGITGQKIPAAPVGPVLPVKPAALSVVSPQVLPGASEIPIEQPAISPADDLQHWLGAQLKFFKTKAQAGKDPGFWIDYVFENAEEPGCQAILYAIRQGATFENLLSFDAEIAQNPQLTFWFRTVYDAVKSELSRDVDSGGESGDARHPASDGTTSPPGLPGTGSSPAGFTLS